MAIAKGLPPVDQFFMQSCPLCGIPQRMMIRGNYVDGANWSRFPDMGYSFCNCNDIFFTKFENVTEPDGFNGVKNPVEELRNIYSSLKDGERIKLSLWDVYFVNWNCPHEMFHWQVRKIHFLIDMDSFVAMMKKVGFNVLSYWRDMEVGSPTPQHFHVEASKSCGVSSDGN